VNTDAFTTVFPAPVDERLRLAKLEELANELDEAIGGVKRFDPGAKEEKATLVKFQTRIRNHEFRLVDHVFDECRAGLKSDVPTPLSPVSRNGHVRALKQVLAMAS